ncbi:MAG TPA: SpoIIE family protein phosphatase [Candidatus Eisenbacteria bacterium]|nr:SpoIIE family protein phosphatase [Candidatus Eisenbacteria bacterium]
MDRGAPAEQLSWLILPAAAMLLASALSLPSQRYTGLTLRGDEVMAVEPDSPGDRAGIRSGDRLQATSHRSDELQSPLAGATPGRPIELLRRRGHLVERLDLMPIRPPPGERRMLAALFAVASGFVLLGGLVWSERRDRLTRPFYLLCMAFAVLLAPPPAMRSASWSLLHELLYTTATLALPALCIHFFALFPEPRAPRGRVAASATLAYGIAFVLTLSWVITLVVRAAGVDSGALWLGLLQAAAAVWFASGLLLAVALFARSYLRAGSEDARRRLRVALLGTALGLGPLAALTVWRNLAPDVAVPGERLLVVLTLLVPLSFTWATVIHRVFDFRVAVRAAVAAGLFALTGGAVYVAGELATALSPDGADYGGLSLALVGVGAALAGPARPLGRALGRVVLPWSESRPLSETLSLDALRGETRGEVLEQATAAMTSELRLHLCIALEVEDGSVRGFGPSGPIEDPPRLDPGVFHALAGREGIATIDDLTLLAADRQTLRELGVHWLMAVGEAPRPIALLLGRRLAGPWLDRREVETVSRFARLLSLALENFALRHAARTHGELDRELALAGAIQTHLLPRRAPVYPTLDCAAATLSSEAVGGDYYDFVERSSRELTLVVGDAAGKGVPAALRLAGVQARFKAEVMRGQDPGSLLQTFNLELARHQHPENFVGLVCARIDVRAGKVLIANAGLEPPLLRRRSGEWESMAVGGVLLGVDPEADYPEARADLGAGDLVLIYTDGLTEARRADELFGTDRVREVVDQNAHRRAVDLVQALIQAARCFADRPLDDLTVVVLKQLADPPTALVRPSRPRTASSPASWSPIPLGETTGAVSPARAANPRAADPIG